MLTLAQTLASNRFAATPAQLEALAALVVTGETSRGVYLQTLIAATQAALPARRNPSRTSALAALEAAHKASYAAVQRGVVREGEALTPRELAARSGFARTSASALRKWLEAGGEVRTLVPGEVTRRMLRPEAPDAPAGTTRAESLVLRAVARIKRTAERVERREPDAARSLLESALEILSARLDAMADGNSQPPATVVTHRLQRVSSPARPHA